MLDHQAMTMDKQVSFFQFDEERSSGPDLQLRQLRSSTKSATPGRDRALAQAGA
jgi:hypothetical protein